MSSGMNFNAVSSNVYYPQPQFALTEVYTHSLQTNTGWSSAPPYSDIGESQIRTIGGALPETSDGNFIEKGTPLNGIAPRVR